MGRRDESNRGENDALGHCAVAMIERRAGQWKTDSEFGEGTLRIRPRNTQAFVERQFRQWKSNGASTSHRDREPVITVSRQFGARGAELGRAVAARTGYSFWDRELLARISGGDPEREQLLAELDEHQRNLLTEAIGTFTGRRLTASEYEEALRRVVLGLEKEGGAIVIGRGAEFIVDPTANLRVRVVAPREWRMRGLMQRRNLTERDARAEVDRVDRERRDFLRSTYGVTADDLTVSYDVTINIATIDMERAVDMVLAAFESRFGRLPGDATARLASGSTRMPVAEDG